LAANAHHALLNLADFLLLDVLYFLDEDSVGLCMAACKRLRHVAKSEALFESLCRRIFPVQCPRVALAAATNRFALRKFSSWFHMLQERPRVRHNGFYYLKTFYYKKPELNMWTTDIAPGTILQVVYYRYFSFQRDGTVLYAMIFKPPHEAGAVLKRLTKEVYIGSFQVDKHEVFVSVPTSHNVVEFKFRISADKATRGKNAKLVLQEHYAFSEPDRSGWVDYFDTAQEEFPFYRQWDL
jgi:F-box protein 9